MNEVQVRIFVPAGSDTDGVFFKNLEVIGLQVGGGVYVNLTPHPVVVRTPDRFDPDAAGPDNPDGRIPGQEIVFPPSGYVARASMETMDRERFFGNIPGRRVVVEANPLPKPAQNTVFIVSALVAQGEEAKKRDDVVAPDTDRAERDADKRIISVPGFVRYA